MKATLLHNDIYCNHIIVIMTANEVSGLCENMETGL